MNGDGNVPTRVREAELLLTQSRERGSIPLPQLTDVDLCVFTDSFATLLDKPTWDAWWSMTEEERDALAASAMDFLAFRRLLRPIGTSADGTRDYQIQPELGYVLAARQSPTVLGVCSVPGQLRVGDLRVFALRDETHSEPCVVLERSTQRVMETFGRVRQYALATADAAGGVVADWVRVSMESDFTSAGLPRFVEFYRHPVGRSLGGERLTLMPMPDGLTMTHTRCDTVMTTDRPMSKRDLAAYVAALLKTGGA
jgi:hypothetical protein